MADIYVLNVARDVIGLVDTCESIIWTPRYFETGDFELYVKADEEVLSLLKVDNYVMKSDSDMIGIIESVHLTSDLENGDHIIATGRCAKSILDRRIVWSKTTITGTVEDGIRKILTENFISPSLENRKIGNFVLGSSNGFTETISTQYTGDNVLDVVVNLCKQYGYGFKVILNDKKNFEFVLYQGVNRSYEQTTNDFVVFSPEFENIVSSEYQHDKSKLKNACNVAGEGEGLNRKTYGVGTVSGLNRREMYVDARDLVSEVDENTTLTTDEYNELLIQRGLENLAENPETFVFDGEVESIRQYVFGKDYFLGDIVTVKNSYGVTAHPRVIGVIQSHDDSGEKTIPTFSMMEINTDEGNYLLTENGEILMTEDGEKIEV